ncbi:MAG: hypothetical protein IKF83_04905 [Clostridia bacterium]|nr:hypothetical protein [Clostridia bacterium]
MKKKFYRILTIIIIFVSIYSTNVFGYTCDIEIIPDVEEVQPGETIEYELKATNIDAGNGIVMFQANVKYDSAIFEYSIENSENWSKIADGIIGENMIFMARNGYEPGKTDEDVAILKFKAKQNASSTGNKKVQLNNIIITADDDQTIEIPDKTIDVKIIAKNETDKDDEENENKNNYNDDYNYDTDIEEDNKTEIDSNESEEDDMKVTVIDTESMNEANSGNNQDASTSNNKLPYTGAVEIIKTILLIAAIASAIVFYRQHNKWKKI